jgi:DNA-binding MarR family transcriptional regulator
MFNDTLTKNYHGYPMLSNAQLSPCYTSPMSVASPRWLSVDEQRIWRSFLCAYREFFASVDAQLQRDAGMPLAYYEILVRLSEAPGRALRMSQLAEATGASKSRASHAVARLEERGWISRQDCPIDRRGQIAVLTDEGFAVLQAATPAHVEHVRTALFDVLNSRQLEQVVGISEALIAGLQKRGSLAAGLAPPDGPACLDGCEESVDGSCGEPLEQDQGEPDGPAAR